MVKSNQEVRFEYITLGLYMERLVVMVPAGVPLREVFYVTTCILGRQSIPYYILFVNDVSLDTK